MFGNLTPSPSPLKNKQIPVNKRMNELDLGDELSGYGLQGLKVTQDELTDLIAQLGLDSGDAGDLVKGLSDFTDPPSKEPTTAEKPKGPVFLAELNKVIKEGKAKPASEEPKEEAHTKPIEAQNTEEKEEADTSKGSGPAQSNEQHKETESQ